MKLLDTLYRIAYRCSEPGKRQNLISAIDRITMPVLTGMVFLVLEVMLRVAGINFDILYLFIISAISALIFNYWIVHAYFTQNRQQELTKQLESAGFSEWSRYYAIFIQVILMLAAYLFAVGCIILSLWKR